MKTCNSPRVFPRTAPAGAWTMVVSGGVAAALDSQAVAGTRGAHLLEPIMNVRQNSGDASLCERRCNKELLLQSVLDTVISPIV